MSNLFEFSGKKVSVFSLFEIQNFNQFGLMTQYKFEII
jgi:hypothetical protein